jgi:HAD superfamily hydrolase (TIGR01490 family)
MSSSLAIFDLDSTLLDGDCEMIWCQYMLEKGLIGKDFLPTIEEYCRDYEDGLLDYSAYERYLLSPLKHIQPVKLQDCMNEFMEVLNPFFRLYMLEKIEAHRHKGHVLLLATASNHLLAQPVASFLGISNLICTWMEMEDGVPTGEIAKPAPFRELKVKAIAEFAGELNADLAKSWGYSDSHNDISFLTAVGHPVAVTPDKKLREHASQKGWQIIEKPL